MTKKKVSPGLVLFIMLMSMTGGAICLNKVAPVLTTIVDDLNLSSAAQGGLLISVFVFAGIFLSLPIGMIITKYGYYKTGLVALMSIIVGSVIGALNLGYGIMLFSRAIEGVGLIFLATIGPAVVANVFSDKNRASAMGLLMCFMCFGQIAMFNLAPRIVAVSSWQLLWWISAAYGAVFLIIWFFALRNLDSVLGYTKPSPATSADKENNLLPKEVYTNKSLWLVGLTFMLYLIAQQGVISFLPTFLVEVRGMDFAAAGSLVSGASIVGIPVGIFAGVISDKIGSRKKPIVVLMFASAVVYAFMPTFPTALYLVIIILYGLAVMGIVGLCFSAGGELVAPQHSSMAMALLNTFQWTGIFLSSVLFGFFIDKFGWSMAFYIMVPLTVIGAISTLVAPKVK